MITCRICKKGKLQSFLSLGSQAPANAFVERSKIHSREFKAPLVICFCDVCSTVQLRDILDRSTLFQHYAYFSSTSPELVTHFTQLARTLSRRFPKQAKQLVVDIGSNDGVFLRPMKALGSTVLGVDPAKNIAMQATASGVPTNAKFFSTQVARDIKKRYGRAGIIVATNVLAHTDNPGAMLDNIRMLLSEDGIAVFEVHSVLQLIANNQFDTIYHEHIFYFSLTSLMYLLAAHHLRIIDVEQVSTHGGSLRVYAVPDTSMRPQNRSISAMRKRELTKGLTKFSTYKQFATLPPKTKHAFVAKVQKLKREGKIIAGYGASAKASTFLQYTHIGPTIIRYIVDSTPAKQGTYTPGTHIPVVGPRVLRTNRPDYIVIFAWNYRTSIERRERWFRAAGGKFIIPYA